MEQAQKKTKKQAKTSTSRGTAKSVKTDEPKKTTRTVKTDEPKKTTRTVKTDEAKKTTKSVKTDVAEKTTKSAKSDAVKKTTKSVKVDADNKKTQNEAKRTTTTKAKKETKPAQASTKKIEDKQPTITIKNRTNSEEIINKIKLASQAAQNNNAKSEEKQTKAVEKSNVKEEKALLAKNKEEKKKNKKQDKKYLDISIGMIIAALIILALIVLNVKLGIYAYDVTKGKNATENESTNINSQVDNLSSTQEVGHVLNKKSQVVAEVIDKITFTPNATASIYKAESFNIDTIPNALKLRLGWAKIKNENKLRAQKENGEEIISVEKALIQEKINYIFGSEAGYNDQSFNNTEVKVFSTYCDNQGVINYSGDLYVANTNKEEAKEIAPFIYQEIQKVLQYNDRVIVYVKTAFVDVKDGKYILYKDYNNAFKDELLEIAPEELFKDTVINQETGEGTITLEANTALDTIREKLNTYTYTLTLDESTGEYYLSEFNKQ